VRHHHERLNGSGYPDGLRGEAIPLSAQIVGIVDAFDAITSLRPYRAARSREQAFDELVADGHSGLFDRELVSEFLRLVERPTLGIPRIAS
jgi:HD-GYP domain-containing protein (c-di-GMP phosphodiesterase class II)